MLLKFIRCNFTTSQVVGLGMFLSVLGFMAMIALIAFESLSFPQIEDFDTGVSYSTSATEPLDLDAILSTEQWQAHKPKLQPYDADTFDNWVKIQLESNVDIASNVYVVVENSTLDLIDFYRVDQYGIVEDSLFFGDMRQLPATINYSLPTYHLELQPKQKTDVYIRVRTNQGASVPVLIYNEFQFNEHRETLLIFWGGFLGSILLMTLYYISLYRAMNELIYLYYAVFAITTLAIVSVLYGFSVHVVPMTFYKQLAQNLGPLTLSMMMSMVLFTRAFVTGESKRSKSFQFRLLVCLIVIVFVTSIFPDKLVVLSALLLQPILIAFLVYSAIVSIQRKQMWVRYYFISWVPIFICFPLTLMSYLELMSPTFFNRYALLIAVLIQLTLTAMSFSHRQKLMELSRIHQATHDRYTGLPNRSALSQSVNSWIDEGRDFALVLVEVGNYLRFLPYVGAEQAARLVSEVAGALSEQIKVEERAGLNQLALPYQPPYLLRDYVLAITVPKKQVEDFLVRCHQHCNKSFYISGIDISVNPILAAAYFPSHSTAADSLIQNAMQALDLAKREAKHWAIYDKDKIDYDERQVKIASDLRMAITTNKLTLYHQPQVSLSDDSVYGSEVLLRWEHPELGSVSPDEFVAVAEDIGIISDLTQWVVECAMEQQRALIELGYKHHISINVSGKDVVDPGFYTRVSETIKRSAVPCSDITLELTESATVGDHGVIKNLMRQFNSIGVRFSIDDFGTGYSSMEALSEFSFDELKIDRSFVSDMLTSDRNYVIASNTIDLANRLNLTTVAEGVENEQQVALLKTSNCMIGQGYYFSRPLTLEKYIDWLNRNT